MPKHYHAHTDTIMDDQILYTARDCSKAPYCGSYTCHVFRYLGGAKKFIIKNIRKEMKILLHKTYLIRALKKSDLTKEE